MKQPWAYFICFNFSGYEIRYLFAYRKIIGLWYWWSV